MTDREDASLHQGCIDYRFAEEVEHRALEEQAHLIAHAGASYDTTVATETLEIDPDYFSNFVNKDHEQCGVFINIAKDDSDINHQKHMDKLREKLLIINPAIHYNAQILTFAETRRQRYGDSHSCPATAIILGDPDILRVAVERLRQDGLSGEHDLIARPFDLEDHKSILGDLKLSLNLHKDPDAKEPFRIFIFDRNEDNAMILEKKVREAAPDALVETIIVSEAGEAVA